MKPILPAILFLIIFYSTSFSQGICDPGGNIIIYSNYDGGTLNIDIDEDIPNIRIGICSYESVTINITGTYIDNVVEVLYAGYDSDGSTEVTGVSSGIVDILLYPPATISDPDGYPYIICAYDCDTLYVPGGCNTVEQLTDYFLTELTGTFRYSYMQYGIWSGTYDISDGGNCCYGGLYEPAPVDVGISAISTPVSGCGLSDDETVSVTIYNYGVTDVSSVPVNFSVDGGIAITETAVGAIAAGETSTYTFVTTANLSTSGTHIINAFTSIADDADDSNDDFSLNINSLATPVIDLGDDQTACDELTLDANNPGATYNWSTGATTQEIVVTETGGYSVTVTDPLSGCIATDFINVEIFASPIASFTYTLAGDMITFTNTSTIGTYTWDFGDGSPLSNVSSPSHEYSVAGTYTITLTVSNECGDDIYTAVISNINDAILYFDNNVLINIFPNPANEYLNICANGLLKENIWYSLFSINGEMLIPQTQLITSGNCQQLYLTQFESGLYILQLHSSSLTARSVVILQ
ncbi:MAG: PKD domain-containing protein [Chitinophagales bacterium]|nr:PKD domain-containing protein [Chitinophagales bacterium]